MQSVRGDLELLIACQDGSLEAFEELVERYKSLVCSVAYSATGDLALSEDIAQETFLSAWRGLREIRDPSRFRAWLCGIARNLSNNALRRDSHNVTHQAIQIGEEVEGVAVGSSPLEHVLSREEKEILWRALEEIPQLYREPLILYYREQLSVKRVADLLDISPELVKTRLSRGRGLLKSQVMGFVEEALVVTKPRKTFNSAVLAAIALVLPEAAAAAAAATAAKGSAIGKSIAATGLGGAVLGPILGLLGMRLGIRASTESEGSLQERKFKARLTWLVTSYALLFAGVVSAVLISSASFQASSPWQLAAILAALTGAYSVGMVSLLLWSARSQEQGDPIRSIFPFRNTIGQPAVIPSKAAIRGSLAGGVFASVCWIFPMAISSGDYAAAVAATLGGLAIYGVSTNAIMRHRDRYFQIAAVTMAVCGVLNFLAVNLRWDVWMVARGRNEFHRYADEWPLWLVNSFFAVLMGGMFLHFLILNRGRRA